MSNDVQALKLAVTLYILVFAMKAVAFLFTGVLALFAEASHTLSDVLISGFLLPAAVWSSRDADADHMFGHGRAQNVAALVAATFLISFTSYMLYEESIPQLMNRETTAFQNLPVAIGVLLVSIFMAAIPFIMLFKQKERGPAAKVQLRELVNDELGLFAALLGTLFVVWGEPLGDPIATMVVATVILYGAIGLFRENMSFLIGKSPGPEFVEKIEAAALSVDGVLSLHKVMVEYVGPKQIHAGFHIEVRRGLPIEEADRISLEVHKRVKQATGCRYCVIHVDPEGAERVPE